MTDALGDPHTAGTGAGGAGGTGTGGDAGPRVELFGKAGCHLCDDARAVVETVCEEMGIGWTETDILDDPALLARLGEYIPVVLVDGAQHDFWRIDPRRLRAALS